MYDPGPGFVEPAAAREPAGPPQGNTLEPETAASAPTPRVRSGRRQTLVNSRTGTVVGAVLVRVRAADSGRVFALQAGRNTVGRADDNDVTVDDGRVSSQHGFLFVDERGARFLDVSSNGSVIDGEEVVGGSADLTHGSRIQLGDATLSVMLLPPEATE